MAPLQQTPTRRAASAERATRANWASASRTGATSKRSSSANSVVFDVDELRFGLSALTGVYRERLVENVEAGGDARSEYRVGASLRAHRRARRSQPSDSRPTSMSRSCCTI